MVNEQNHLGKICIADSYFCDLISDAVQNSFGVSALAPVDPVEEITGLVGVKLRYRGVKTSEKDGKLYIEIHLVTTYGLNLKEIAKSVSHKIKYTVYEATGMKVEKINVFIDGVIG